MLSLLRLEGRQKKYFKSTWFRILIFLFLSYSLGTETINTFIHFRIVPPKPYPIPDLNRQSIYPFSKGAKTLPNGAAHNYIAYIREYHPSASWQKVDLYSHFLLTGLFLAGQTHDKTKASETERKRDGIQKPRWNRQCSVSSKYTG